MQIVFIIILLFYYPIIIIVFRCAKLKYCWIGFADGFLFADGSKKVRNFMYICSTIFADGEGVKLSDLICFDG